ncbi:MAG: hypothetical protein KBF28_11170 [Gemmatimonadales bacterium]|nr:hypothetical protein [Gemmatimonadales bacterium]
MKAGTTTPCADSTCRTVRGYIRPGEAIPTRQRGLCHTCWQYHQRHGTLAQFPRHTGPRKLQPTWLVRQYKERIINLRVAMHEAGGLCPTTPLVEGQDNTGRRIRNADRFVAAYAERQGRAA